MSRIFITLVVSFIALISYIATSFAQETLTIITENGPPHMIQSSNSGIDIDITSGVLGSMGYKIDFLYAPLKRAKVEVEKHAVDLTVPTFFAKDTANFYVSQPIIDYRPTVFSTKPLTFESLEDIKQLKVSSFQGATGYFGDKYVEMTSQNTYAEVASMESLVTMLVRNRVDVIILDYYIFYYYLTKNKLDKVNENIYEYTLIPPVKAAVGFNNKAIRDKFNQAYNEFEKQGHVKRIVENYIGCR